MSFVCIPMQMNLIKAPGEKGSGPFSFERNSHLSSPSRSCLGRLILHPWWTRGLHYSFPTSGARNRDLRIFGTCTDQKLRATIGTDSTPKRKAPRCVILHPWQTGGCVKAPRHYRTLSSVSLKDNSFRTLKKVSYSFLSTGLSLP